MKDNSQTGINRIRSYKDLEKEKARLKTEISNTENKVNASFNRIVDAFTFRNVIQALSSDLALTSSVFYKAYEKGRELVKKRKDKKKKKKNIVPPEE